MIALLENIRSLHNVGSIFRSADAFNIEALHLAGLTGHPHPDEPWRRDHLTLHKTALGAEETVPWHYAADPLKVARELQANGFQLVSLELTPTSMPLSDYSPPSGAIALVVGNEVTGISPELLTLSDTTIHIPMRGHKESLNVGVAFAIAAWYLTQKTSARTTGASRLFSYGPSGQL